MKVLFVLFSGTTRPRVEPSGSIADPGIGLAHHLLVKQVIINQALVRIGSKNRSGYCSAPGARLHSAWHAGSHRNSFDWFARAGIFLAGSQFGGRILSLWTIDKGTTHCGVSPRNVVTELRETHGSV